MLPRERRDLAVALTVAAAVTAIVTVLSVFVPDRYVATAVGLTFFGATWALVWRNDDEAVRRAGLAFGGLVLPGPLRYGEMARALGVALAWALTLAAVSFVPFVLGWLAWARIVWQVQAHFTFRVAPFEMVNAAAGQVAIIALPEEAFYRGYLQSTLDLVWAPRFRVLGATVGPSILVTSAIFALGHFATQPSPARLAVFFPSLLFGWLRARTRGVGASVAFHAMCNVLSETLMKGYGLG